MESLHYLLMKTHAVLSRRVATAVHEIGLTSGQPKVLDFLSRHPEADQKTIAAHCEIEQTTVGSILTRMEKAGLVTRRRRAGDRRCRYVSLTREGHRAAEQVEELFARVEAPVTRGLSAEELEQLKALLEKAYRAAQDPPRSEEGGGPRAH